MTVSEIIKPMLASSNEGTTTKNNGKRLVAGVGINDVDYRVNISVTVSAKGEKQKQKKLFTCPFYRKWTDLLKRVYSKKYHTKFPTYIGTTICQEWLYFSKFKSWMEKQDYEGKELDKDVLFLGNKHYSPETCIFVSKEVNYLFLMPSKGSLPLGVRSNGISYGVECKVNNKYSYCNGGCSIEEASNKWKEQKILAIEHVIKRQKDERVVEALKHRIFLLTKAIENNMPIYSYNDLLVYET